MQEQKAHAEDVWIGNDWMNEANASHVREVVKDAELKRLKAAIDKLMDLGRERGCRNVDLEPGTRR